MGNKQRTRDISKNIRKNKKRVAGKLDKQIEKNQRLFSLLTPIFIGAVFLVCSIIKLDASVSFDEAYSAYLVRGDFGNIVQMTTTGTQPPLFYVLLKMWSSVFGASDIAMRFMSVFLGLVAVIFLYELLKRLFNFKAAAVGTFFMAISPMFIRYGQEIGMYMMAFTIALIATYVLVLALDNIKKESWKRYWIVYGILVAMGMLIHYLLIFIWIAHLYIIVKKLGGMKKIFKNKKVLKRIGITYGLAVILFIPWVPALITQLVTAQENVSVSDVSMATPVDFISNTLFYKNAGDVCAWLVVLSVLLLATFGYGIKEVFGLENDKNRGYLKAIVLMIAAPIILMTVCSLPPLRSIFTEKNVLCSVALIWVLIGLVMVLMKNQRVRKALIISTLVVAGIGIFNVETREPDSYVKEILGEVFAVADKKEPILMENYKDYYSGVFYSSEKHPVYIFNDSIEYKYGLQEPIKSYKVNIIESTEDFLSENSEIWYVVERSNDDVVDVPEIFSEYYVKSEISLEHYTALELAKN